MDKSTSKCSSAFQKPLTKLRKPALSYGYPNISKEQQQLMQIVQLQKHACSHLMNYQEVVDVGPGVMLACEAFALLDKRSNILFELWM